jgi:RNA polymerase sigma factor (TIGR02999 family)
MSSSKEVTQLLVNISNGNQSAYQDLFPLVYGELKRIANIQLNKEYGEHTLSRTELVHETYMKLVDQTKINYNDRKHFYAIAARSIRQILVDYARMKKADKRGGGNKDLTFEEGELDVVDDSSQIIAMDSLLNELMELDERLGKIVELRFFAGLNIDDTADLLGISTSTANRDWKKAKGWLYQQFKGK